MRIKKFVISNIILSIILITTLYGLSWGYINYVNDITVKFMEYNKLPNNSVDIVTIGSSHGKFGIKLDKENQMNLALEQQNFYYGLKLLEKYEAKIKKGAIVILPMSIFSFHEEIDLSKNETYKNYINLLDKKNIRKDLKDSEYILIKNFSIIYPPERIINFFNWVKECIKQQHIKKNNLFYKDKKINKNILEKNAPLTVRGHLGDKEKIKIETGSLEKIFQIAKKNKWKVFYTIVPNTEYYNLELENIEENVINNHIYNNIKKAENKEKVWYKMLDYSKDKRFVNKIEYFMDETHLNEKGAEYFTKILLNDIEKEIKNEREI